MKFFLLLSGLLAPTFASTLNCGEGRVKDWMNVCISPEYIPACKTYKSETECHECQNNYKVNAGKCEAEDANVPPPKMMGCLEGDEMHRCLNCANGFKNVDGKCEVGIENCQKYKKDGTCSECKVNYSLLMNECKHNILLGCKIEKADHTCKQCWKPFNLVGKHCDVKNCMNLNDYGCVSCKCGFYLTEDKECKKISDGCLRFVRGSCVNCLPHYDLKDGKCEIEGCKSYSHNTCEKCNENFKETQEGGCQIENCFDWDNEKCTICDEGFRLADGNCVESPKLQCQQ